MLANVAARIPLADARGSEERAPETLILSRGRKGAVVTNYVRFVWLAALWVFTAQGAVPSCEGCHDDVLKTFERNRHVAVKDACAACHRGAEKHAESADPADITNPAKLPTNASDPMCLSCHRNKPSVAGRIAGSHARGDVGCTSCHSVHTRKTRSAMRTGQCSSCHTDVVVQFGKPHAHNLRAVACADCHNPHGNPAMTRMAHTTPGEPGCGTCHGDKRGPFTFEHAPVKMEGCGACHEPHGSSNPRMLVRHDVQSHCLECHAGTPNTATLGGVPPAFHDLRSPRFRNCTTCHVKIHGSYTNRALLR